MEYSKRFSCGCGDALHSVCVVDLNDPGDPEHDISLSIINSPFEYGIFRRIKAAWMALMGWEHIYSEVVLAGPELDDFIEYLCEIRYKGGRECK